MNKDNSDVRGFKFDFGVVDKDGIFEYIVKFEAKYGSYTQKLCDKYAYNFS